MIIICSGPDTYRAREKAKELMAAFRVKHDTKGLATEVVDGADGVSVLLSRLASASLFAQKKMIRADGCFAKMKIADVRVLAARLEQDKDQTVIVTVEEDPPVEKTLEALKIAPLFHYPFPLQTGSAFKRWVREEAARYTVDQKTADKIAERTDGDSWFAMQEIIKQSVHPHELTLQQHELSGSVFDAADAVLTQRPGWRDAFVQEGADSVVSVALAQIRSFLRIRDSKTEGIHPYVVKKLGALRVLMPEERMREVLCALYASRTGLCSTDETENLLK